MQGAGNDFIVLDETQALLGLSPAQYRLLADRHFGVGADQILSIRPAPSGIEADFSYVIHNADGGQVAQCGNGARCFARFIYERGLSAKKNLRVHTLAGVIEPKLEDDGQVTVNMGLPILDVDRIPFQPHIDGDLAHLTHLTQLAAPDLAPLTSWTLRLAEEITSFSLVSMGNPHAVIKVPEIHTAPVSLWGPLLQNQACFPDRVNVGFMQIQDPDTLSLRVYERGAGETLACGTGACAAAVSARQQGLVHEKVTVHLPGGSLTIQWKGLGHPVYLRGPADFVFDGEIDLPATAMAG